LFLIAVKGGVLRFLYQLAEEICEPIHVPQNLGKYLSGIPEMTGRFSSSLDPEFVSHLHYDCGEELDYEACLEDGEDWGLSFDVSY
jgi:hypothetical protein